MSACSKVSAIGFNGTYYQVCMELQTKTMLFLNNNAIKQFFSILLSLLKKITGGLASVIYVLLTKLYCCFSDSYPEAVLPVL